MSLKYTKSSDIAISRQDGFKIATVNSIIRRLIENDQTFFSDSIQPGIWECRWYNDIKNSNLYYKKGDAVWINTESADDFIMAHISDIETYIQGSVEAKYKYMSLSAAQDQAGIYKLYKDIALGLGDFDRGIYYLGNLLDKVQIRISLSDNNDKLPTDNNYWTDFFDESYNKSFYSKQILDISENQLSSIYNKHLINYHLSGLTEDPDEFYAKYLKSDLSNLSKYQNLVNHAWYQPDMTGFDCVILFGLKNYKNKQVQWFRLWKSGLLEHGGMIDVGDDSCGSNNKNTKLYTVNLKWEFDNGISPSYDFSTINIGNFYSIDNKIYTGNGNPIDYRKSIDALSHSQRYIVDITPIQSITSNKKSIGPYPFKDTSRFFRYLGKEVTEINNSSFTFLYSHDIQMYSYYVKGFTVKVTKDY